MLKLVKKDEKSIPNLYITIGQPLIYWPSRLLSMVLRVYFTVRKISAEKNYDVEVSETQEMHNKKSRILASNDFFPSQIARRTPLLSIFPAPTNSWVTQN